MSMVLSALGPGEREAAIQAAVRAVTRGKLIVVPTDTVYGVAADAFDHEAVRRLLLAKGRGRAMPPPVLISSAATAEALATRLPDYAHALIERFWPGPLTIVAHQQPSLRWDLGETRGTVAIRMPDHDIALQILERTGPLAVSSANTTGQTPATEAWLADRMLGNDVAVIVDAGPTAGETPSTILDVTGDRPRVLRAGVLEVSALVEVLAPLDVSLADEG